MKTTREEHEAAIAADTIARQGRAYTSLVCRQLSTVPDVLVMPAFLADVLDALIKKVEGLPADARENALGYLTDCRDDMRHFAEQS